MAILFIAGDQEPFIPLVESTGSGARYDPAHIGATWSNTGTTLDAFTTIVIVVVTAHCPGDGVKV